MINIHQVYKSFEDTPVLKGIDLFIPKGSNFCIVGPSGSGKSVLMKLILGLEMPDQGEIFIEGISTNDFTDLDWRKCLENFGVVFQGAALFDSLSVWENVGLKLLEERRFSLPKIKEKVKVALGKVNLEEDIMNKMPSELSGGMRKRVGIARAIIDRPSYLVYDEPSTGLDPVSSVVIDQLMLSLAADDSLTSIIVTHDMQTVRNVASHVAMIHSRSIIFSGTKEEFLDSDKPEILAFLLRENR